MRRFLPAFLLVLSCVALGPFALTGCDLAKLKGGGADAGANVAVPTATTATAAAGTAVTTAAATDTATAAQLGATTTAPTIAPGPTPVHPLVTDGGVHSADAGVHADGGRASPLPMPTPTLTIPPNFFDGGLKLPAFDAGAFKPPWQR
jgi:hypothetical protein